MPCYVLSVGHYYRSLHLLTSQLCEYKRKDLVWSRLIYASECQGVGSQTLIATVKYSQEGIYGVGGKGVLQASY